MPTLRFRKPRPRRVRFVNRQHYRRKSPGLLARFNDKPPERRSILPNVQQNLCSRIIRVDRSQAQWSSHLGAPG